MAKIFERGECTTLHVYDKTAQCQILHYCYCFHNKQKKLRGYVKKCALYIICALSVVYIATNSSINCIST